MTHLQRVAASERVASPLDYSGVDLPADWGFYRHCMPYFLAARDADTIDEKLRALEALESPTEIEAFFVEQLRSLGLEPVEGHEEHVAPQERAVASWIAGLLDSCAGLREKALPDGDEAALNDYAVSTWIWLAQIFARTRPCFWQGRNRWLGNVAHPEEFQIQTSVAIFGGAEGEDVDPALAALIQANRQATQASLAVEPNATLREILVSTATLVDALAMQDAAKSLHPAGSGSIAAGAVRRENLPALREEIETMRLVMDFPYGNGEWLEIVLAAALAAERGEAALVEGDDAIYGAYRWPPLGY